MLICKICGKDASTHISSWKRKNGKIDYRCVCGSKLKPIEDKQSSDLWLEESGPLNNFVENYKKTKLHQKENKYFRMAN